MSDSSPDLEHVDVSYVANLARLALTDEEVSRFQGDLDKVVAYIHKLDELDLDGIEPMSHPRPRENVLREDVPVEAPDREAMLENAPSRVGDLVKVPQMMEDV
jgi:aspartyl-tRNA(Asn)/glutamyl-tRNA(Gln) amidotransferase subunit C